MDNKDYMISIDSINEGIVVFRYKDDSAYLEYANTTICQMLDFNLEDLKGASYVDILKYVYVEDVEGLRQMVNNMIIKQKGDYICRFIDFAGNTKWISTRGQYLKDEEGYVAYYACFDITEQIEATQREQRLTKCIQLITDNSNFKENMNSMLECLRQQYLSHRAYIFEFDWANNKMTNSFEVTATNITPEIQNLQDMPIEIINYWLPSFKKGDAIFIEKLEEIKDDLSRKDEYDVLAMQDINSLMVVPIQKNKELFGYIGVDNPLIHMGDRKFLNNIAFILSQEFLNRKQQRELIELSLTDPLTKLNNRHAYNKKVEKLISINRINMGIVFTDVNGLKYVNDQYGHLEGDLLIKRAASILAKYFVKDEIYRISGDEFVVLVENIDKEEFLLRVTKMKMDISSEYGLIFSVGEVWNYNAKNINDLIKRAEEIMYEDKEIFYTKFPTKNRRR